MTWLEWLGVAFLVQLGLFVVFVLVPVAILAWAPVPKGEE